MIEALQKVQINNASTYNVIFVKVYLLEAIKKIPN